MQTYGIEIIVHATLATHCTYRLENLDMGLLRAALVPAKGEKGPKRLTSGIHQYV
jgi:hypothetical protein